MTTMRDRGGHQTNRGRGRGRGGYAGRGGRGGASGRRSAHPFKPGPKLPAALAAEVDPSQAQRAERKINHSNHHTQAHNQRVPYERIRPARDRLEEPEPEAEPERPAKRRKLPELSLPAKVRKGDAEDGEIEWLEYMLRKENEEDGLEDGLDDLLNFADDIGPGGKGLSKDSGDREQSEGELEELDSESDVDPSEADDSLDQDGDMSLDPDEEVGSKEGMEDESEAETDDVEDDDGTEEFTASAAVAKKTKPDLGEDATRATTSDAVPPPGGTVATTKYIPPHMRAAQLDEKAKGDKAKAEAIIKLERKAQGLLNKLGESNLDSILGELEALYRDHSRHDVTTTLTNLIMQMIANKANLLDSFVVLYATVVGALYRVIGVEFGAHFTHTVVMRYHQLITGAATSVASAETIYESSDGSKESTNLLTLISELYNAQVISAKLIYDLIRGFLDAPSEDGVIMGERQVEGLLRVIKCSGPQLRSEDPASLKDIVNLVQEKTKGQEKTMTARARFMIETLQNLKSGKGKAVHGTAGSQAAERMKKFLSGLGKKQRVLASEPIRVSLGDLLSADTRGKWWLVGAAWSGNPLVEREERLAQEKQKPAKKKLGNLEQEELLLDIARKQGMNTDIRRSIFVVLMTSEDYTHACDRMSQFKLSEVQQRDCVRVTLHCVGSEKTYNPYYTLVLNHLCSMSYAHRFTTQYALWDLLRSFENDDVAKHKVENTATAMAYIVARGAMDLTVFKAVDFTSLRQSSLLFFRIFIRCLILGTQSVSPLFTLPRTFKPEQIDLEAIEETFAKALSNPELAQGLLYVVDKLKTRIVDKEATPVVGTTIEKGLKRARTVLSKAI